MALTVLPDFHSKADPDVRRARDEAVVSGFAWPLLLMMILVTGQLLSAAHAATVFRVKGAALPLGRRP
jgi:hypothetical protein